MTALKINTCIWDARVHARSSRSKPFVLGRVGLNAGVNRPVICSAQGSQPVSYYESLSSRVVVDRDPLTIGMVLWPCCYV